MTIKEAVNAGNTKLNNISEVYILLSKAINRDKLFLLCRNDYILTEDENNKYISFLDKRLKPTPISYILGEKDFYGRTFFVDENVLIPRPETEIIIDLVKSLNLEKKSKIIDICTGSGIIPVTLGLELGFSHIYASDISKKALETAKKNADMFNQKITFIESDMFKNIYEKDFDLIISNPPYITEKDMKTLSDDVKCEPSIALYGGLDGLDFYRELINKGKNFLNKNGMFVFEIGYNQSEELEKLAKNNGFSIEFIRDLQGIKRTCLLK